MAKDEKVCRMIEALSMMLTAAIARGGDTKGTMEQELRLHRRLSLYPLGASQGAADHPLKRLIPRRSEARVPCLILQPIVENAIEHGIAKQDQRGTHPAQQSCVGDTLVLEVENDGKMAMKRTVRPSTGCCILGARNRIRTAQMARVCGSIGIRNVNRRLKLLYGEEGGLTISEVAEKGQGAGPYHDPPCRIRRKVNNEKQQSASTRV